ncbi:hypothetical protein Tco_0507869 [Tanacetum coccineum]
MGRGTWYYSLGVFLEIVDVFVRSEFEISSWRGARVDVRTYLLGGAIDSSEANGIIRDPKLELESSRFTFDLVPLSYESVDVVVGENWLLRHKAKMNRISYGISTKSDADLQRLVSFDIFRKARGLDDCRSCKVRVGSNGNLLWEASFSGDRKKVDDILNHPKSKEEYESHVKMIVESVKEEKMYVKFSNNVEAEQRGSYLDAEGIKWVLMKDCMANVMLFVDVGRRCEAKYEFEIDITMIRSRLTNRWLMKKDIASCGSKYLECSEMEVEYQGSSDVNRLILSSPFLAMLRTSMVDFRVLMPRVVKSRDEIFSRWGYCDNHDLSKMDNQSIERDRLIGIGFVLNFVKFISFTFGDKEMISVIEAIIREVFVKLLLDSFAKLNIRVMDYPRRCYVDRGHVPSRELHENTEVREILFLYCYAFSVSLLLTPLCCDDIHDVTPRVSALAGCDRLVSEPLVIKNCKTRVSYDLVISREEHQFCLLRRGAWSSFEVSVGITEEGEVVTYLRFIANFSKIVKPLTSLTERNQKYEWGAEREEAFQTLKNDLCDASINQMPPVLWVEIGESSLTGLELVQETSDKIKVDKTLRFVEEPVENSDREVKRLKCSRMVVVKAKLLAVRYHVKVRWNSKRGPEFTWEREDYMKSKYPQLFVERADESAS